VKKKSYFSGPTRIVKAGQKSFVLPAQRAQRTNHARNDPFYMYSWSAHLPQFQQSVGATHTVDRVLSFLSNRPNWDFPFPSHAGECATPTPLVPGEARSLAGEGVGVPIPTRGQTQWYSSYISTLWVHPSLVSLVLITLAAHHHPSTFNLFQVQWIMTTSIMVSPSFYYSTGWSVKKAYLEVDLTTGVKPYASRFFHLLRRRTSFR